MVYLLAELVIQVARFSMTLEPNLGTMPRSSATLLVSYLFCGSALADSMDNLSQMCPIETRRHQ